MGGLMADRTGLKFVGFLFASVTVAVVMTCGLVVKGHADGRFTLDQPTSAYASSR